MIFSPPPKKTSPLANYALGGATKPSLPSNGNSVQSGFYAILPGRNRLGEIMQLIKSQSLTFCAQCETLAPNINAPHCCEAFGAENEAFLLILDPAADRRGLSTGIR